MPNVLIKGLPTAKSDSNVSVNRTLQPTPRNQANVEAEKDETVVTDLNFDGLPEHYTIAGNRHSSGGTPLNLPQNSFIFSDTPKMRIKDKELLKFFGKKNGGSYTPAELAKQYDINKYRAILADPNTDKMQRKTAELMIANYNEKLAKLALAQESMKGFPDGIPFISVPYVESMGINPADFGNETDTQREPDTTENSDMAQFGKEVSTRPFLPNQRDEVFQNYLDKVKKNDPNNKKTINDINENHELVKLYLEAQQSNDPKKVSEVLKLLNQNSGTNIYLKGLRDLLSNKSYNISKNYINELGQYNQLKEFTKKRGDAMRTQNQGQEYLTNLKNQLNNSSNDEEKINLRKKISDAQKLLEGVNKKDEFQIVGQPIYTPNPTYNPLQELNTVYNFDNVNRLNKVITPQINSNNKTEDVQPVKSYGYSTVDSLVKAGSLKPDEVEEYIKELKANNIPLKWLGGENGEGGVEKDTKFFTYYKDGSKYNKLTKKFDVSATQKNPTNKNTKKVEIQSNPQFKGSGEAIDAYSAPNVLNKYFEPQQFNNFTIPEKQHTGNEQLGQGKEQVKNLYDEIEKVTGKKYDPFSKNLETRKEAQRGYNEYLRVLGKKANLPEDEINDLIKSTGFVEEHQLPIDPKTGKKVSNASIVDGKFFDESGKPFLYSTTRPALTLKKQMKTPTPQNTVKTETTNNPIQKVDLKTNNIPENNNFWTEDLNNIRGAAYDKMALKKYMPWQAPLNYELPNATYYDPTRELAANAEQANIASQALGMYAGPQQLSARLAATQGKAAGNAADILAKYNNLNVQTANANEQAKNQIINQNYANQQQLQTNLYDKVVTTNQQFDNAKAEARQKLRDMVNNAWTNRGQTQGLNAMQQNYRIDPTTGYTYRNEDITPEQLKQQAELHRQDSENTVLKTAQQLKASGYDKDVIEAYLKAALKSKG